MAHYPPYESPPRSPTSWRTSVFGSQSLPKTRTQSSKTWSTIANPTAVPSLHYETAEDMDVDAINRLTTRQSTRHRKSMESDTYPTHTPRNKDLAVNSLQDKNILEQLSKTTTPSPPQALETSTKRYKTRPQQTLKDSQPMEDTPDSLNPMLKPSFSELERGTQKPPKVKKRHYQKKPHIPYGIAKNSKVVWNKCTQCPSLGHTL